VNNGLSAQQKGEIVEALKKIKNIHGETVFHDANRFDSFIRDILQTPDLEEECALLTDAIRKGVYARLKTAFDDERIESEAKILVGILHTKKRIDYAFAKEIIEMISCLFTDKSIFVDDEVFAPDNKNEPKNICVPISIFNGNNYKTSNFTKSKRQQTKVILDPDKGITEIVTGLDNKVDYKQKQNAKGEREETLKITPSKESDIKSNKGKITRHIKNPKVVLSFCMVILTAIAVMFGYGIFSSLFSTNSQPDSIPAFVETEESVEKTPAVNVGDTISFGNYDWRILDVTEDKMLVLSKEIFFTHRYHYTQDVETLISWENSEIRRYLNEDFFNTFSESDKQRIAETHINNNHSLNFWSDSEGFDFVTENTTDRIFLLSLNELLQYFGDSGRFNNNSLLREWSEEEAAFLMTYVLHNTDTQPLWEKLRADSGRWDNFRNLCIALGYFIEDRYNENRIASLENEQQGWWLRSRGWLERFAVQIDSDGTIIVLGRGVSSESGIRPALWLKLD
jgi:hypothetical protein